MKNSVKYNNILISRIDDIENSMTSFRAELDKIKSTKVVTNESLKKIDELDSLAKSDDFFAIIGYINTEDGDELKGEKGNIK